VDAGRLRHQHYSRVAVSQNSCAASGAKIQGWPHIAERKGLLSENRFCNLKKSYIFPVGKLATRSMTAQNSYGFSFLLLTLGEKGSRTTTAKNIAYELCVKF